VKNSNNEPAEWLPCVAGFQKAFGLGFVFGVQAGLFAGRAVLHVEHFAAPEQGVFRFHNWLSLSRYQSCFNGGLERALWQSFSKFWPVTANCITIRPVTDTFADSGHPSCEQTLINKGFY